MTRLLILPILLLTLLIGNPAHAADWKKGLDAYKKKDYVTALRELEPFAKQGDAFAQYALGFIYAKGLYGLFQNYKTAVKWYKLAAEQGNASAQYELGRMYKKGTGVIKDYTLSHMWFNIAASQGHGYAQQDRDFIEKKMSPTEIETAKILARECLKKNYKGCGEIKPWWKFW